MEPNIDVIEYRKNLKRMCFRILEKSASILVIQTLKPKETRSSEQGENSTILGYIILHLFFNFEAYGIQNQKNIEPIWYTTTNNVSIVQICNTVQN